jgi:hypothetical protein
MSSFQIIKNKNYAPFYFRAALFLPILYPLLPTAVRQVWPLQRNVQTNFKFHKAHTYFATGEENEISVYIQPHLKKQI